MPDTLDADARWAAAAKLADGMVDDRLSRRRRWTLTWISALIIGSMLLGLVLGLWLLSDTEGGSTDEGLTTSRLVLQGSFLVLGLATGIGGFIWARRTGRYITRWRYQPTQPRGEEERAPSARRQASGGRGTTTRVTRDCATESAGHSGNCADLCGASSPQRVAIIQRSRLSDVPHPRRCSGLYPGRRATGGRVSPDGHIYRSPLVAATKLKS